MKVCFFDIDGTLILSHGAGYQAFARAFRDLYGVTDLTRDVPFAGRSDRAIALDLMTLHGIEATEDTWHEFQEVYLATLPETLVACDGQVLPGVEALIAQLQTMDDVGLGLLTGNVIRGAEAKLTHFGLWHHFAFGGYGDIHPHRDDIARSAVLAASDHLKLARNDDSRLVVIGDTVHDITCARAIGAYAVAVPTGFTPMDELRAANPDLAVETLEDAQALVDWLAE
ncbi:HAD family hydrolase [Aeoliella mucimassa]|uniref:phosphoglycolate phosphatase n=1 Tax=Aeoliella mucimassa TaxID=2527972 RepID=A0A518AK94_9BACT|nr:HAD family hydrolase [Aeoliella mucimassa]QDU55157.1 Phosphoglycolate phosphatase [Aeoliella mucimassa]